MLKNAIPVFSKDKIEQEIKVNQENENSQNDQADFNVAPINPDVNDPISENSDNNKLTDKPNDPISQGEYFFISDEPYPEITDAIPSMYEVKLIKWLASSRDSEFSEFVTYLYQSFVLKNDYPEIADALNKIVNLELTHYELLSNAIVDFSGNPNLTDGRGNVWTGRNVLSFRNVKDILSADIKMEEKSIKNYQLAITKTCNLSLANLFERLIIDEQNNIIILNKILDNLQ